MRSKKNGKGKRFREEDGECDLEEGGGRKKPKRKKRKNMKIMEGRKQDGMEGEEEEEVK